jgi:predicted lipoprotein with Yx(FWY)xxD motif
MSSIAEVQVGANLRRLDEGELTAPGVRTMRLGPSGRRRGGGVGVALALVGIASLLAACSSSSSSSTTTTITKAPTTTTSGVKAVPGPSSGTIPLYEVSTGTVSGLGTVLVAGNGFTLYMFVPDKDSGVSTCYNACAEAWPPLLLTGAITPVYGHGVNPNLIGTTKRTDGTVQVTYKGWPLYLWAGDSEPGQATGQAINNHGGLWYVLNPAGKVLTKKVG